MAKKPFKLAIRDFSGGTNTEGSSTKIADNQFRQIRNMSLDRQGTFKRSSIFGNRSAATSNITTINQEMAGKGLFRFKTNYSNVGTNNTPIEGSYSYTVLLSNNAEGGVSTLTDTTPTHTAWQASLNYTNQIPESTTSENGVGAVFSIAVSGAGACTFSIAASPTGVGYKVGDTLTFRDPGNTNNTATIEISGIANSGALSLPAMYFYDEAQGDGGSTWTEVFLKPWRSVFTGAISLAPVAVSGGQRITAAGASFIDRKVKKDDIITNTTDSTTTTVLEVLSQTEMVVKGSIFANSEEFSMFSNPVPNVYTYGNSIRISDTVIANNNPSLWYGHIKRNFFGEGIEYDKAPAYVTPSCALEGNSWELYEQELKAPTIIKMDACFDLLGQVKNPMELGIYVHEPYEYENGIPEEAGITDFTHNPGESVMWMDALGSSTFSEKDRYAFTYIYDGVQESELSRDSDGNIGVSGFKTIQTKNVENKPLTFKDGDVEDHVDDEVAVECLHIYTKSNNQKASYRACLISLNCTDADFGSHKVIQKGDVLRISSELVKVVKVVGNNINSAGTTKATFQVLRGIHGTTPVNFEGHEVYLERPPQKARAINVVAGVLSANKNVYIDCEAVTGDSNTPLSTKITRFHVNPHLGIYGKLNKKWQDWWGSEGNYIQGATWGSSDAGGKARSYQTETDNEFSVPGSGISFRFEAALATGAANCGIEIYGFKSNHRKYSTNHSVQKYSRNNKVIHIKITIDNVTPSNSPTIHNLRDIINNKLPTGVAGTYNTGGAGTDIGFAGFVINHFVDLADFVTVSAPEGDAGYSFNNANGNIEFDGDSASNDYTDFDMPFSFDKRITGINLYWNPEGEEDWYLVNSYDVNKGYSETALAQRSLDTGEDVAELTDALEFVPGKIGHQVQSDFGRWIECPYWTPHSTPMETIKNKLPVSQINNGIMKFDRCGDEDYELSRNVTTEDIVLCAPIGEIAQADGDKFDNSEYGAGGHRSKLKFNQISTTYCKAANVYSETDENQRSVYRALASMDFAIDAEMITDAKNVDMTASNNWAAFADAGSASLSQAGSTNIITTDTDPAAQGMTLTNAYIGTVGAKTRYVIYVKVKVGTSANLKLSYGAHTYTLTGIGTDYTERWHVFENDPDNDAGGDHDTAIKLYDESSSALTITVEKLSLRKASNDELVNTLSWGIPYLGGTYALQTVAPASVRDISSLAKVKVKFNHNKFSNGLQYIQIPTTGGAANPGESWSVEWGWYFRGNYIIICDVKVGDELNRSFPDKRYGVYKIASDHTVSPSSTSKLWIDPSYKEIPSEYNGIENDSDMFVEVFMLPTKIPVNHAGASPSSNLRMGIVYNAQTGVGSGTTEVVQLEALPQVTFGSPDAETTAETHRGYEAIACRPRGDAVTTMYMPFDGYRGLTYQGLTERAAKNRVRAVSWKSSTIINASTIIGGIDIEDDLAQRQKERSRIMWTLPNRFDEFTFFRSRDIGSKDGDEIVDITSWNGALVVMKKNNVYIVDPNQNFKEVQRISGIGLSFDNAYCKTPYGIVIVHKTGVYLMPEKKELSVNVRSSFKTSLDYSSSITNNKMVVPTINFNTYTNELYFFIDTANINQTSGEAGRDTSTNFNKAGTITGWTSTGAYDFKDMWVYNFDFNSWTQRNVNVDQVHTDESTLSNFVQTGDDGLMIMNSKHGTTSIQLKKSNHTNALSTGNGHCIVKSKDYNFGSDDTFKYIKYLHITYKSSTGIGVKMYADSKRIKEYNTSSGSSSVFKTKKIPVNFKCRFFKFEIWSESLAFNLDDIVIEGYDTGKSYGAYETTGL